MARMFDAENLISDKSSPHIGRETGVGSA